jgi:hypothetical protein
MEQELTDLKSRSAVESSDIDLQNAIGEIKKVLSPIPDNEAVASIPLPLPAPLPDVPLHGTTSPKKRERVDPGEPSTNKKVKQNTSQKSKMGVRERLLERRTWVSLFFFSFSFLLLLLSPIYISI